MATKVGIKRAYDDVQASDGYRVFVDRLWPRGVSKENLKFDAWCKDLAPSPELRVWFGHKIERWDEFKANYETELRGPEQLIRMRDILAAAGKQPITLVYAAKDLEHNNACVLAAELSRLTLAARKTASK
ncbi:MAG: DUF488 family protein [Paralcaligenes sp.]